ncbi:MAG: CYTH domain-containing protein [Eubacteriales bacterium]|nr:CYTH domain-containing protein [Eubacteriales bacterium]
MEIERKFTVKKLPDRLESYPSRIIEQAYLNTDPVLRIRREDEDYYLTYKGRGLMAREEYNLPLNRASYEHLLPKADGVRIAKRRYRIPFGPYTIELDIFAAPFAPLVIAEVEFSSVEEANAFVPPEWFDRDVTRDPAYHNSNLSKRTF